MITRASGIAIMGINELEDGSYGFEIIKFRPPHIENIPEDCFEPAEYMVGSGLFELVGIKYADKIVEELNSALYPKYYTSIDTYKEMGKICARCSTSDSFDVRFTDDIPVFRKIPYSHLRRKCFIVGGIARGIFWLENRGEADRGVLEKDIPFKELVRTETGFYGITVEGRKFDIISNYTRFKIEFLENYGFFGSEEDEYITELKINVPDPKLTIKLQDPREMEYTTVASNIDTTLYHSLSASTYGTLADHLVERYRREERTRYDDRLQAIMEAQASLRTGSIALDTWNNRPMEFVEFIPTPEIIPE